MAVTISSRLADEILADIESDPAHERCGLLIGNRGTITAIRPAANIHPDPARFFEADPHILIATQRALRGSQAELLGHYHSHPTGDAMPSHWDAKMAAADGRYWLIIGKDRSMTLWQSIASGALYGRFNQLILDIL